MKVLFQNWSVVQEVHEYGKCHENEFWVTEIKQNSQDYQVWRLFHTNVIGRKSRALDETYEYENGTYSDVPKKWSRYEMVPGANFVNNLWKP